MIFCQMMDLQRKGYNDKERPQPTEIFCRSHNTGKPAGLEDNEIDWNGNLFYFHLVFPFMNPGAAVSARDGIAVGQV